MLTAAARRVQGGFCRRSAEPTRARGRILQFVLSMNWSLVRPKPRRDRQGALAHARASVAHSPMKQSRDRQGAEFPPDSIKTTAAADSLQFFDRPPGAPALRFTLQQPFHHIACPVALTHLN